MIQGFTNQDFDIFLIDGLGPRMEALKAGPRPKLEAIGQVLAPELTSLLGQEFYAHIAKHARRTVNPPSDTWVALAANQRGYKMVPHFQVGLWPTHLFIRAGMIYEAEGRARFAQNLLDNLDRVREDLPAHYTWLSDYTQPLGTRHDAMTEQALRSLAHRLATRKQADAMVGLEVPRAQAVELGGEELLALVRQTFRTLVPVYKLAAL